VDRDAERHRLAFARILAREGDRVAVAALAAFGLGAGAAAAHLALGGDAAVGNLVALAGPLHQFIGAFLGVLGLLVVGAGHGARIGVAALPATVLAPCGTLASANSSVALTSLSLSPLSAPPDGALKVRRM
jgi:hypothetical protein